MCYMFHVCVGVSVLGVCICVSVCVGVWVPSCVYGGGIMAMWRRIHSLCNLLSQGISIRQRAEEEDEEEGEAERNWCEHEDEFELGEEDEEKGDVDLL